MAKNKPRIHITVNVVRALPPSPAGKKDFIWDDEVRGFGAYRTSAGEVVFVYQFRMSYRPARRATIGKWGELAPAQAREIARGWSVERRQGVDPVEAKRDAAREQEAARDLVLSTYVEQYLARREAAGNPLSPARTRLMRNDVVGLLGDVRIDRMTVEQVEGFVAALQSRSKSARRFGLIYLKVVLNDARKRGKITRSPADTLKIAPRSERDRFLTVFELQRVLESFEDSRDYHADAIEVLLRTLRRKEEVAAMSWEEIDPATWTWTVPDHRAKTRVNYTMELPPQVVAILERQQPDPALRRGWVFSYDGKHPVSIGTQEKNTLDAHVHRRVELAFASGQAVRSFEQWQLHDFRTTGATHLGEEPLNVRDDVIELCLAHVGPIPPRRENARRKRGHPPALEGAGQCTRTQAAAAAAKPSSTTSAICSKRRSLP